MWAHVVHKLWHFLSLYQIYTTRGGLQVEVEVLPGAQANTKLHSGSFAGDVIALHLKTLRPSFVWSGGVEASGFLGFHGLGFGLWLDWFSDQSSCLSGRRTGQFQVLNSYSSRLQSKFGGRRGSKKCADSCNCSRPFALIMRPKSELKTASDEQKRLLECVSSCARERSG